VSLFDKIFKPKKRPDTVGGYRMINGFNSVFSPTPENLYEISLVRACVHAFASACSKFTVTVNGASRPDLQNILQFTPNPVQDLTQFIYRIATVFLVNNTAFILPVEDAGGFLTGYYPIRPSFSEVVDTKTGLYLRYTLNDGKTYAIELERVGVLTNFQYNSDIFGSGNEALKSVLDVLNAQNQGIVTGIKNTSSPHFFGKFKSQYPEEQFMEQQDFFTKVNFLGGKLKDLILGDNRFEDLRQIDIKPFQIDPKISDQIRKNVFAYFGVSESIVTNDFTESQWLAYFEGKIEPFMIQLSNVMTNMTFTRREKSLGNKITFTAGKMRYGGTKALFDIAVKGFDHGFFSVNEAREILDLPPVDGGDKRYIRLEYGPMGELKGGGGSGEGETDV